MVKSNSQLNMHHKSTKVPANGFFNLSTYSSLGDLKKLIMELNISN